MLRNNEHTISIHVPVSGVADELRAAIFLIGDQQVEVILICVNENEIPDVISNQNPISFINIRM